jgi:hypothetical protein
VSQPLEPDSVPPPADDEDRPSIAPFLAALAIIVIVVAAIALLNHKSGDGLTEQQRVGRAAVGQNDALQRGNYLDLQAYTCGPLHGFEPDVLARQRDSVSKRGARYVDDVTDVVISGDRATATVTYHFDKAPDTKTGDDVCPRGWIVEGLFARTQLDMRDSRL